MTCPVCGTVAIGGARFCHHCGAALPESVSQQSTERRVVTVIFGDLSDFTTWSEDLDPERVGAITDRVLAVLAQAVTAFGGHVDKLTGDGIMAVFGAPVTHEDDPERAVRAALAMQRAVRRLVDEEEGGGRRLGLRVGVNTGTVAAGVQAALSYTVIGDAVNTAARLSDAAGIGGIYAGAATAHATRDRAAWRRLPPLRLKGKREPVEAYELLGLRDAPGTRPGLGDEAPFVGRESELGRLTGRLAEVTEQALAKVVVLTAEAGMGKTRLAAELARHAEILPEARVLQVRCAPYGDGRLVPLAGLVRLACGAERGEDPGRVAERVQRTVQRLSRHRDDPLELDVLLELVGAVPADRAAPSLSTVTTPGGFAGDPVPAAVAGLCSALAIEGPVLIVVDDVHNAAPETVEALGEVAAQVEGAVLVLLLGRPELVRTAGVLVRLPDAEPMPLPPLSGAAASRLLRAYLGGGALPTVDENRLLATAQGNPYYLAELVSLLVEQGKLIGGSTGWRLAAGSLSGRLLSTDLRAVFAARIDALPPDARVVLRDASVVGERVPEGALLALRKSTVEGPARAERALSELVARRMLRRSSRGGYAFVSALMRQAAYAGVGKADLADRHARLARWGQTLLPEVGIPVETGSSGGAGTLGGASISGVAGTLGGAGTLGVAGTLGGAGPLTRVGSSTGVGPSKVRGLPDGAGFSPQERDAFVAGHAEQAKALAEAMGLPMRSDARTVAPLGVAALGRLAEAALADGQAGRAASFADRAEALAEGELPPEVRLIRARACVQTGQSPLAQELAISLLAEKLPDQLRAGALLVSGEAYRTSGYLAAAAQAWTEAVLVSRRSHLHRYTAEALRRLGMQDYLTGRLLRAEERFSAAYRTAVKGADAPGQGWALQHLAWAATSRADFTAAEKALDQAGELFGEIASGRSWISGTEAFLRLLQGRLGEARRLAKVFIPFGERAGDTWGVAALRTVEAYAAAELGELTHAEAEARSTGRVFETAGEQWGRSLSLVVRGVVARGRGDSEAAIPLLEQAVDIGHQAAHPLTVGIAGTVLGYCRLDRGQAEEAEADARAVLEVIEPLNLDEAAGVGPVVLLAQARRAQGDHESALKLLTEVVARSGVPSLVFPRRQALAHYSGTLLEAARPEEALQWALRAQEVPAEDIRSRIVALRALGAAYEATGKATAALEVITKARDIALSTELTSERPATNTLAGKLGADEVSEHG